MTTALSLAGQFLQMGIGVFPVKSRDKRPEFSMLPLDPADGRPTWEPFKTLLPSMSELQKWFSMGLQNYGVITGWMHLTILDFDDAQEYTRWVMWVQSTDSARMLYENAYKVRTARGVHVYVRTENKERARKIGKIDIKSAGGYVLGPGSIHPTGAIYTPLSDQMFFPLVRSLSEILPADLLLQDQSAHTPIKQQAAAVNLDPWARASNPTPILSNNDDLIKQIRAKFKLETFFSNPTRTGSHWLMTQCPFHDDKHPSFWIDETRQICGCLAGCTGKPLDVINLIARLHSLSNREAILYLAKTL